MNKVDVMRLNQLDFQKTLGTSADGLSQAEVAERQKIFGLNRLSKKGHGPLEVFVRQLKSALVVLLGIGCAIAFALGDYADGLAIAAILLVNTGLGFFQEYRSERTVEAISKFIKREVWVRRNGQDMFVEESEIVPGDLILLRKGDIIVADMRLITGDSLQVDESQLTGESAPVIKKASETADNSMQNRSLLFAGSVVEKGEGVGIVYATGQSTELGTIAALSIHTRRETQYEKSLKSFSSFLIKVIMLILALVFIFKITLAGSSTHITQLLLFVIAMAVGAVPEVLPVIATLSLSSGVLKLAKKDVVVKRLSSVEDLGNVTMLCTDKTGTITENSMNITGVVCEDENLLLKLACACIEPAGAGYKRFQSSYDEAFLRFTPERIKEECRHFKIVKKMLFDPDVRRERTVLSDHSTHKHYLVSVGSCRTLLAIANTPKKEEYEKTLADEGKKGIRHLGVAYKEIQYGEGFDVAQNESDLTFLGYVTLLDPLRATAKHAIKEAEKLGVAIKILSGDNREVAGYVGREIGLIREAQKVYTGDELDAMPPETFKATVNDNHVFAQVTPGQKYKIIQSLKHEHLVAYQGDGINDAPSLKLADVSIAVDNATDLAKESADIVLTRNNLEVVVDGIKYGRTIFVNINKYIVYTMISNFGNLLALAVLFLLSADLPMLPIQVLLVTVIVDVPLIIISSDSVEEAEVMQPEKHKMKELLLVSLILGIPTALFIIFYFVVVRSQTHELVATKLFVFIAFLSLIIFYAVRNKDNFWKTNLPPRSLNLSFFFAFLCSILMVYVPLFQAWFSFAPLRAGSVTIILVLMVLYFFAADFVKVWYYRAFNARHNAA